MGPTGVEDFLKQFKAVSALSSRVALTPDPRPRCFSASLTGDALIIFRSLIDGRMGSYDQLKCLFCQQYKPNANVLKAQANSFRHLPGQVVSVCGKSPREFAAKANTYDAVRNELLQTKFERLVTSLVSWELRKLYQQCLRSQSFWRLKSNLTYTSTAKSPTFLWHLSTL